MIATENELKRRLMARCAAQGVTDFHLDDLKASPENPYPMHLQQKVIDAVCKHGSGGWAFFGPPGVGKTTLANLLFKFATERLIVSGNLIPNSIWRVTAQDLCKMHQERATGKGLFSDDWMPPTPAEQQRLTYADVTREKIQAVAMAGLTPRVFLEEWDKIGLTDTRRNYLFDIVDALYTFNGQFVMTSNLTWVEFQEQFGQADVWRIEHMCHIVDMFNNDLVYQASKRSKQPKKSDAEMSAMIKEM